MASKGTGMSFSRKSYRLTSDAEKSRVTGKGWHDRGGGGGMCFGLGEGEGRDRCSQGLGPWNMGFSIPLVPGTSSLLTPIEKCAQCGCSSDLRGWPKMSCLWDQ
jgi:hypothetical protein